MASEAKKGRPYHLALVIDRSGSMTGAPLAEAVRCAKHIADQLEATDVAALVVFDAHVQTVVAARPVGNRTALHLVLSRVHSGGTTNLQGGWQAGADELLPDAGQAALARVILRSDGNANVGEITDTDAIAALAIDGSRQLLQAAVTASTPEGQPLAFADALLMLPAMPVAAGKLLEEARAAAEHGDWNTVERLLADARQRFADQPWVIEGLENMAELARSMDTARFHKEALYSSRKMSSRISAKEEALDSLMMEAGAPSFLRRKTAQGKAQFDKPEDRPK